MIKKFLLTILTVFSLSACSSVKFIHEPVGCLGQPKITMGLTADEYSSISEPAKRKIVKFAKKLRARINAQCKLNGLHDKQYLD